MGKFFLSILFVLIFVLSVQAMYVESNVHPGVFWIRKVDSDTVTTLVLRVRWNIEEVEKEDMDGVPYTMYEYEEQEVLYALPAEFDLPKIEGIAFSLCPIAWQSVVNGHLEENREEFVQLATEIAAGDPYGGQVEVFSIKLAD